MPAPAIEVRAKPGLPLGMPPARFLRDYWQKRPLLIRKAFPDFQPPLSPDDLAGLACMDGALARIIRRDGNNTASSSRGRAQHGTRDLLHLSRSKADSGSPLRSVRNDDKWKVANGPFDDATFAQLPETDWTLLVQDVDKWDADTAVLLDAFSFIPSWRIDDVMVSYAANGGGVGAHVDQYDVFLLQGLGQRRWAIDARANPSTEFRDDVELKLLKRFTPSHEWVLDPGDMLYLPPGVPHDGVALGECTTFSIGMRAPASSELLFDLAAHVAESLPESQRFIDPDLAPAGDGGEIDDAALRRVRRAIGPAASMLDDDALADWFGSFITRYRAAQVAVPRKRKLTVDAVAKRLEHSIVQRDTWSRFAWRRKGRDASLYVAGNRFDVPLAWARQLASARTRMDGAQLAKLPQEARGLALLAALVNAGYIDLQRN
ncbi:MAG TPA: cupin domain-containing protein [Rhodanobacteraceae bacterium]